MSNMPITLMEDSPPYLDFSVTAKRKVRGEGEVYFEDCEIVTSTPMGDNKTQVIKEVDDWLSHLKEREHHHMISPKFLKFCEDSYNAWKENRAAPINGTPFEQCSILSPAEIEMVRQANIRSVDDLANCNDEGLQAIGMGARKLKDKAKAYLDNVKDHGAVSEKMVAMEADLNTANEENERLAQRLAALEAKLDAQPIVDVNSEQEEAIV